MVIHIKLVVEPENAVNWFIEWDSLREHLQELAEIMLARAEILEPHGILELPK